MLKGCGWLSSRRKKQCAVDSGILYEAVKVYQAGVQLYKNCLDEIRCQVLARMVL